TRTGVPTIRVASASNCGRNWFQSMKYGPTSAAINAMMKAIANPSSVVCTVSPLGCRRARPHPPRADAGTSGNIEASVAGRQRHGGDAPGSLSPRRQLELPARRQLLQPPQHETLPPLGILRVIQPQVGNPAQQGVERDFSLDPRQLGAE